MSLPFQLLLGGCSARECTLFINGHKSNEILIGSVIWETISLGWDLDQNKAQIYRLKNQWSSVYTDYDSDLENKSFFIKLILFCYHIIKYVVFVIFCLAGLSLLINLCFKWREVLAFIRGIFLRMKKNRGTPITENEQDEDFRVSSYAKRARGRRMQRLPA